MFFEGYTEKLWGRHPSEIAADWGAQRVKGLSILSLLKNMLPKGKNAEVETSLIEQFWISEVRPRPALGRRWRQMCRRRGAKLQFGHSVKRVVCEGGSVKAVVCSTPEGEKTVEGDIFISSMPVKDLVLGMESAAPARVQELAAGLPYRDFVTVGLLVPPPWAEKRDSHEDTGQHRARLLDLCAGPACEAGPHPDFQQLVPLYGKGIGKYRVDWP